MENNNYPAWKHALLYGLYIGIVLIILSLVFYIFDLYTEKWIAYISYAALLAGVVLSCIYYRDKHLNGFITYGQSVGVGFLSGLFAGVLAAIFTFIFMKVLGDDYTQTLLAIAEENMLSTRPDMSDEELELGMKMAERMMRPGWMSILAFLGYAVLSLIFALLASIFIKKEDTAVA